MDRAFDAAEQAYDDIRGDTGDVGRIAHNTGLSVKNIRKVKTHLFHAVHLLDRYLHLGVAAERRRFDADPRVASLWRMLAAGEVTPDGLQLLRHETAEAWYMRQHGDSYAAAHEAAQARFPSPLT